MSTHDAPSRNVRAKRPPPSAGGRSTRDQPRADAPRPPKPPGRAARTDPADELSMTLAELVRRYPISTTVDPCIRRAARQRIRAVLTPIRHLPENYIPWCYALRDEIPGFSLRAVQQLIVALSTFLARAGDADRTTGRVGGEPGIVPPGTFHRRAIEALTPDSRYIFEARVGIVPRRTLAQLADEFGTHKERVRTLEREARHSLRALGIRYGAWQTLDFAFRSWWPRLCRGGVDCPGGRKTADLLEPPMRYLCEAVGGLDACLARYCERVNNRWLLKADSSEAVRQRALAFEDELLEEWMLPQPLFRLAGRFDLPERDIEVLLRSGTRLRCEHGYVVAKPRRNRPLWLDGVLRNAGMPLTVSELNDRLATHEPGRVRDLYRTLSSAPHLFLRLWDHQWCSLTALPRRLRATPHDNRGSLQPLEAGERDTRYTVLQLLHDHGPMTWAELARAARPNTPRTIASAVARLPDVVRCAPGIYGYRGHLVRDAGAPPAAFFRDEQATAFALGRFAGLGRGFFPFWTAANEMALCLWAREHASAPVYQSLVAQADPAEWPGLGDADAEWWRLERERCDFVLQTRRDLVRAGTFPASRLLAVLLVGALRGRISWIEANRCLGARVNARSGLVALAILAMTGTLLPDPDWRASHPIRADQARTTLTELLDPLCRTGKLEWSAFIQRLHAADACEVGWFRPEAVGKYLGRARRLQG